MGCCAPNCTNSKIKGFRVFRFPQDPNRREEWLINTGRNEWSPTPHSVLCEEHFEESQFEQGRQDGWRKLKPNAVPTLFNAPYPPAQIFNPNEVGSSRIKKRKDSTTRMSPNCCVPDCDTGYSSLSRRNKVAGMKIPSIFRANPATVDMLMKWQNAMPRNGKSLKITDGVCELHFEDREIERYYVTRMPDGTEHTLLRGRPSLKSGAVPSKFPNLPNYLSKRPTKMRKVTSESLSTVTIGKETEWQKTLCPEKRPLLEEATRLPVDQPIILEPLTFDVLLSVVKSIKMPCILWTGTEVYGGKAACWIRWNDDLSISKRVTITEDMTFKVFLREKEVCLDAIDVPITIEDVCRFLQRVENMRLCEGLGRGVWSDQCTGYVGPRQPGQRGPLKKRCRHCQNRKKSGWDRSKQSPNSILETVFKLRARVKSSALSNERLRKRVAKLWDIVKRDKKKSSVVKKEAVEAIQKLPKTQQEAVRACIAASKYGTEDTDIIVVVKNEPGDNGEISVQYDLYPRLYPNTVESENFNKADL